MSPPRIHIEPLVILQKRWSVLRWSTLQAPGGRGGGGGTAKGTSAAWRREGLRGAELIQNLGLQLVLSRSYFCTIGPNVGVVYA